MPLTFDLIANNSSGEQKLHFTRDEGTGELFLTLTGEYKYEDIQIDFEPISKGDVADLIYLLKKYL